MKHLSGKARAAVAPSIADCLAFLADIAAYPDWYPDVVKGLEVVESDDRGRPSRALTTLHLAYGPVARDLELLLALHVHEPGRVELRHIPRGSSSGASFDATWSLEAEAGATQLGLELDATMPVPHLVPLGGVGDAFATSFMGAAVEALGARA